MSRTPVSGIVLVVTTGLFVLVSAYLKAVMVAEVNRKLPADQQLYFIRYYGDYAKLRRDYRRLYPSGQLLKLSRAALLAAMLFMVGAAWSFGFFRAL